MGDVININSAYPLLNTVEWLNHPTKEGSKHAAFKAGAGLIAAELVEVDNTYHVLVFDVALGVPLDEHECETRKQLEGILQHVCTKAAEYEELATTMLGEEGFETLVKAANESLANAEKTARGLTSKEEEKLH